MLMSLRPIRPCLASRLQGRIFWRPERPNLRRKVGRAVYHFRARRAEIDEPILEDRLRHRFKRLVHPPVQIDLLVQRTQY